MRLSRPRFTILSLMIVVVIASLVLTVIVVRRERNRRIAALQVALANFENARLTREVAEIAVIEYTEGVYKQDLDSVEREFALAESDLKRARDPSDREWARLKVKRAQSKRAELENDIKRRTVKELMSEVTAAKADELAKKSAYEQLKAIVASQW